jgi:hypothetical protein
MNEYIEQAKDFLEKHGLALNVREAVPQKKPIWHKQNEENGINYYCVLSNKEGKSYGFDFWGSIKDKENDFRGFPKHPNAYNVLSCLDTLSDGYTFEDFCSAFGYDEDSRTAEKVYEAVKHQTEKLKEILTIEAQDDLNKIL